MTNSFYKTALIFLLLLVSKTIVIAQPKGYINTRFDKMLNTYSLNFDAKADWDTPFANFELNQRYKGITLISALNSERDDQEFGFLTQFPLNSKFSFVLNQNWLNYQESPSNNINSLNRLNALGGIRYSPNRQISIFTSAGAEQNTLMGLASIGSALIGGVSISDVQSSGYVFNSNFDSEYLRLNYDRSNFKMNFDNTISKSFDEYNSLDLDLNYFRHNQDYIQAGYDKNFMQNSILNRVKDSLAAMLNLGFAISDNIIINANLNFDNQNTVNSFFENSGDGNQYRLFREIDELNLALNLTGKLELDRYFINFGINARGRDETNSLRRNNSIPQADYSRLSTRETIRDNFTAIYGFNINPVIPLTSKDTIEMNFSSSMQRYDTPHLQNFSDNDILRVASSAKWSKRMSPILNYQFMLDFQARHIVFLKSARSSLNNWNRIIRLTQRIEINSTNFKMQPQIELIANYTVYDFQDLVSGLNSDSFRRIGYRDRILILFGRKSYLELNLDFKYQSRGILYWNDFTETPIENRFEYFTKAMYHLNLSEKLKLGIGSRIYGFKQKNISRTPHSTMNYLTFAPETEIMAQFFSLSTITLSGWYELQFIDNSKQLKYMPNVFLTTRLYF